MTNWVGDWFMAVVAGQPNPLNPYLNHLTIFGSELTVCLLVLALRDWSGGYGCGWVEMEESKGWWNQTRRAECGRKSR